MSIDRGMLAVLKAWKQATQFSADEDWVFASPKDWPAALVLHRMWRSFLIAAPAAGHRQARDSQH